MESQTKQPKNNPSPDKILVLGIGNLVLNDEGIGIHVVNALNEMEIPQGVDVLDGGTGGLALLETLQSYRQLILVDAALDNNPVGTIRRLSPQYSKDYPPLLSAHEIGLKEMIDAMLLLGQAPRIELLAISVRNCHHLGMQLSPEARKAIPQVLQLILEIINDLLDVSKIEAGHLELEQAPFMLDDVVHHVCTVALHNAHAGGIELVVDMDPNMQIALIGDAGRLQQIIMNLVTNAVKFTGPGGQICVTLKQGHAEPLPSDTCPEQRRVQIICFVRDTGVGIAPEFLGQLFQPFRQVDASTTRRHGGTGLGLCICRQLVEMMHGEIWVESEPNVGSTFAFSIPLCTQPDSGATAQLPPPPAQPIHALVLSASPLQTEILCRHFSALGIDALTATNTEEAVRKAQELPKKQPDLLFLDRKLSEPNTLYALRALRTAFGRTIPAILMDEHAGEQILSVSNRDAAQHDGQVAILSLVTLRGLHESIVSLNEPCLVAYSGRLHPQPSPMETPLFHDVRILVAEDNPTNQEIMEALFEDTGVQLTIVRPSTRSGSARSGANASISS